MKRWIGLVVRWIGNWAMSMPHAFPLLISAFQLGVGGRPYSSIRLCSPPCHLHTDGTVRTWQTARVPINTHTHTHICTHAQNQSQDWSVPTGCLHPRCYSSVDLISVFKAECSEDRSEKVCKIEYINIGRTKWHRCGHVYDIIPYASKYH